MTFVAIYVDQNTSQEELEWLVVTDEVATRHIAKLRAAGYDDESAFAVLVSRKVCATFGHKVSSSHLGAPVLPLVVICHNCGKLERA